MIPTTLPQLGAVLALALFGAPPPRTVILYAPTDSAAVQTDCPPGVSCERRPVDHPGCALLPGAAHPHTVIVAGHSLPPDEYLGVDADTLAASVACLQPSVVILDTCYGASAPLLAAMASRGVQAVVVGSTKKLPPAGLMYEPALFSTASAVQAGALVRARSGEPLEVFTLDGAQVRAAEAEVATWDLASLRANLRRKLPNLAVVDLPGSEASILVPVPESRFQ
ncbi:MAG: hypothetical protein ABIO70_03775 [Pseudomonadota bacterium]